MAGVRISLLHATYRRPGGAAELVRKWKDSAKHPDHVEYILGCDKDEVLDLDQDLGDVTVVRNPPDALWSTAVRNWNAAAKAATGDILMVIADDLLPVPGWDELVLSCCSFLDPQTDDFAVKIDDGDPPGVLLRHPVVSRAFYERFGLFDPAFHGMYCDTELTVRAFWKSVIIDGSSLRLEHRHPRLSSTFDESESHRKANRPEEYGRGLAIMRERWPAFQRATPARMFKSTRITGLSPWRRRAMLAAVRWRAALRCLVLSPSLWPSALAVWVRRRE